MSTINGDGGRTTPKTNGEKFNGTSGEATDDVKATQQHIKNLETELKHAREALSALKADRKRLKAEKFDVLNQMKQLYATLEDKEKELREFIRAYEKRMRESESALRQLMQERNEAEREKWTILRHARDEAERCLAVTTQLTARDAKIDQLQEELAQIRQQLSRQQMAGQRISPTIAMSTVANSVQQQQQQRPSLATTARHKRSSISSMDSAAVVSDACDEPLYSRIDHSSSNESQREATTTAAAGSSITAPSNHDGAAIAAALVDQLMADVDSLSMSSIVPGSLLSAATVDSGDVRKLDELTCQSLASDSGWKSTDQLSLASFGSKTMNKLTLNKSISRNGGPWGSISRVFSRASKQRKTLDLSIYEGPPRSERDSRRSWSPRSSLCTTPLTEETVADRFRFWDEAQSWAVERWKAGHVLAWLEFGMGMARYLPACAENIKSGRVLLELSDTEIEAGLGLNHAMHRKKVRLAIEERRPGQPVRYPLLSTLGNSWVANEWLTDIGLTQYADAFHTCLMDARLLDNLTKRELEKHLGVTRKAHQTSIVQGITFLRMIKYDRQAINERRRQCDVIDCDPLVWTNQRFISWARGIDLAEYADNLRESGIHGALVILDPTFNADVMATAMGIPTSKNIIRRHLATELESLVQITRARYEQRSRQARSERKRVEKMDGNASLGRNLSRSFTTGLVSSGPNQEDIYGRSVENNGSMLGIKSNVRASFHASLSRAFGRKIKQDRAAAAAAAATAVSGNGSIATSDDRDALIANSSDTAGAPASASSSSIYSDARDWTLKNSQADNHRRVKSSSDIEKITVTRV
ncbi:kazrin-like isoform X1 [Daphnia pulicaria]|uniref:kazrin-like isoform X1 n=1 Tax=Daphnia pulicaria TaxID=35523 RepID=UPI001EEC136D|nr:kazrin-like isoform X1 [Daphnia pulicaria]XP_046635870.1 kazrin-like isoform X1 [Daphnia pulicaria]XP_046635871.1 kazrin-like isoform X1 [Daphnia pulicaria]